jgi:hypothetical protein
LWNPFSTTKVSPVTFLGVPVGADVLVATDGLPEGAVVFVGCTEGAEVGAVVVGEADVGDDVGDSVGAKCGQQWCLSGSQVEWNGRG